MKNLSFLIAFYSQKINNQRTPLSPAQPLLDYLNNKKVKLIAFIDQPVPLSEKNHQCMLGIYAKGKKKKEIKAPFWLDKLGKISEKRKKKGGTFFKLKIRDFLSVIYFGLKQKTKYDVFIGSESINTLGGIILRKLGKVNRVIYYVIDFAPDRYANKILNKFYLWLDKFCSYHADFCWNNSPAYEQLRIKKLKYNKKKLAPQINLSYGINGQENKKTCLAGPPVGGQAGRARKQENKKIVFNGSVDKENGIDLIIEAIPQVLKKIPNIKLKLIGGGPEEELIKQKIKKMNLEKNVEITGYFFDRKKIRKDFLQSKIGLAIYAPHIKGSIKPYGDPIKFREYMACGLPIITTKVNWMASLIKNKPLGIVINFNKNDLAEAIIKLLEDKKFWQLCRKNALEEAKEHRWKKVFGKGFREIETKSLKLKVKN